MENGEKAKVVAVQPGRAVVEMMRSSACEGCHASHICVMFGPERRRADVSDPIGVHVGDEVQIVLRRRALLKASFIVYVIPLAAFFVGAFLGGIMQEYFGWTLSVDASRALVGFAFLGASFVGIRLMSSRLERTGEYTLTIERVLRQADTLASAQSPR